MSDRWWPPIPQGVTREDYAILRAQQRCFMCAKKRTKEGHDPCLGTLPGVQFACCGHGDQGYLKLENGTILRGFFDGMPECPVWLPGYEPA